MKTNKKRNIIPNLLIISLILLVFSCKKENSAVTTSSVTQSAVAALKAVAVAADSISSDSIYVIGTCSNNHHLDSVSVASLPSVVAAYLTANYAGYTFQKAFTDKDSSGNIAGYVVIIQYNGNPVGLKFDASGNFVRVLEQREGHDLSGNGWHEGGRFDNRDGRHRDTVAIASLPGAISSYFTSNYPQDTLIKAFKNRDGSIVVFSTNNGAFATTFDANGSFIKRVKLDDHIGSVSMIDQTALPAAIQSYLSSTYPDYVFQQAFSVSENGVLLGYVVCINANGTRYAIGFDASGNFIKAITIR